MSGGNWEYRQYDIQRIADDVDVMIITNDDRFSAETLEKFKNASYYMRMAFIYANAIDYLLCDDYSEKSFNEVVDHQIKTLDESFHRKLKDDEWMKRFGITEGS